MSLIPFTEMTMYGQKWLRYDEAVRIIGANRLVGDPIEVLVKFFDSMQGLECQVDVVYKGGKLSALKSYNVTSGDELRVTL